MNWPLYFKNRKNKILAISFCSLALICFVAHILFYYLVVGGMNMGSTSSIVKIIYFLFQGGILAFLLVTNINGDPRAYQAILMWIFWFFLDELQTFLYSYSSLEAFASNLTVTGLLLLLAQPLLAGGSLALGIILYIFVRRYMFGRTYKFKPIRILAICYAGVSFLSYLTQIGLMFAISGLVYVHDILFVAVKLFADLSVIFTLERLRR